MEKRTGISGSARVTLLLAGMMTMIAGILVAPALPLISGEFSHIPGYELLVRLIITLPALAIAVSAPLAGVFCDRIGRRKVLQFGLLVFFLAGTAGAYLNGLHAILLSRALLGVGVAAMMTSVTTLVGDTFDGAGRESFMGIQGGLVGLGGIIFLSLSGFLASISWHLSFLVYAIAFPVLLLSLRSVRDPAAYGKQAGQEQGLNGTRNTKPGLVWLIYLTGFTGVVFFFMVPVQVPFLLSEAGIGEEYIGMLLSLMTVSAALVSLVYRRFSARLSFPSIVGLSFILLGCGFFSLSASGSGLSFSLSLLVTGLGAGLFLPTGGLWMLQVVPANKRGTFVGRLTTALFLGQFLSPVLLHPLIRLYAVSGTFRIVAFLLGASALLFFVFRKKAAPDFTVTLSESTRTR